MRGSLRRSLHSLPALVPAWCIRNTSTGRGSSLAKGVFCCAGFASRHPARWILFVTPSSSSLAPLGLGPCVRCSTYVVVQPNQKIFNTNSRDVAYQPLVRCVGYRRQHSLRGRFAPIRRSISILKPKTQTFLALLLYWLPWIGFKASDNIRKPFDLRCL